MNLKITYDYIHLIFFSFFFFFWGLDFETLNLTNTHHKESIQFLSILTLDYQSYKFLPNSKLSYSILFFIIPIFYRLTGSKFFSFKKIFNYQQYIIFFTLFIVAHFFIVNFFYSNQLIDKSVIANLFYLLLLSVIYCHYRNFIHDNFNKILMIYLTVFIFFSFSSSGSKEWNFGQCQNSFFLINIIKDYLKISLTNSIYLENSHLAMMSIPVFFSGIYFLAQANKVNLLFLLLLLLEIIIVLNNLSTTYFVCYLISQIALLFFFLKKINTKFWIFTILLLSLNSYLFLSDTNCTSKLNDFRAQDVLNTKLDKSNETELLLNDHELIWNTESRNMTTLIYERSIIIALETIKKRPFGWGIDGMDDATYDLIPRPEKQTQIKHKILQSLNVKDGLSNSLKMITEFGIFTLIIIYFFIKYMLTIKNISSYNIFIIVLFITMCIRGAGYFNGGFIFCLLEILYFKKKIIKFKKIN